MTAAAPAQAPVRRQTSSPAASGAPISQGAQYRVQIGDSASTIVSRIENRGISLWPAVARLIEANPEAFVDGDMNRLMAGAVLTIPVFGDHSAQEDTLDPVAAAEPVAAPAAAESAPAETATTSAYEPAVPDSSLSGNESATDVVTTSDAETPAMESAAGDAVPNDAMLPAESVADSDVSAPVENSGDSGSATYQFRDIQPGDVVVTPTPDSVPVDIASDATTVSATTEQSSSAGNSAWSWLLWLAGTAVAVVVGLLLFRRSLLERFRPAPAAVPAVAPRRHDDDPTSENPVVHGLDLSFEESVNNQTLSLDADLGAGTGLSDSGDMDVMEDFGFSSGEDEQQVDLEFPDSASSASDDAEDASTDIIPPTHRIEASSILETEVPPGESTSEYDLSMIVDATKQDGFDATAKDLQAVPAGAGQEDSGEYTLQDDTLGTEVDYQILEQDYEDELTATQALNLEIEKAARELANRLDDADEETATNEEVTANLQVEEQAEEDGTASLQVADRSADDGTASLEVDDKTIEMPPKRDIDQTAELTATIPAEIEAQNDESADTSKTVEMAAAGSDVTVEMQVESGKVDTSKLKKPKAD